jgi:hypothetical protein
MTIMARLLRKGRFADEIMQMPIDEKVKFMLEKAK